MKKYLISAGVVIICFFSLNLQCALASQTAKLFWRERKNSNFHNFFLEVPNTKHLSKSETPFKHQRDHKLNKYLCTSEDCSMPIFPLGFKNLPTIYPFQIFRKYLFTLGKLSFLLSLESYE